jgi:hypothetical protein
MINAENLRSTGSYAFQKQLSENSTYLTTLYLFFQNLQLKYLILYFIPVNLVAAHTAHRRNSMREFIKKKKRRGWKSNWNSPIVTGTTYK